MKLQKDDENQLSIGFQVMVENFLYAAKSLNPCFAAYKNPTSVKNFLIGWVTFGSKLYSHWANILEVKVIGT